MQKRNISPNNFEQCVKCAICTDFCPVLKVLPTYPGPILQCQNPTTL